MIFLEDLIGDFIVVFLFAFFKQIGILFKWMLYFGKKSFEDIQKEKYNTLIGFLVFLFLGFLLYLVLI